MVTLADNAHNNEPYTIVYDKRFGDIYQLDAAMEHEIKSLTNILP